MINPWKILGVHRKSTDEDIREAYIRLAKKNHPDTGGSSDTFHTINLAYNHIKDKIARRRTIDRSTYEADSNCAECKGTGVVVKTKGITERSYSACKRCGGAGFVISEKLEEKENVTIELHGTVGSVRKGSSSGRRSRTSKQCEH